MIRFIKAHRNNAQNNTEYALVQVDSIKLVRPLLSNDGFHRIELVLSFDSNGEDGKVVGIFYDVDAIDLALALHEPKLFDGMNFQRTKWDKHNEG